MTLTPGEVLHYQHVLSLMERLPKHQLKRLSKTVRQELKARYPDHHHRKYGPTVNRGFLPHEYARFMQCVRKPNARLAFHLMHDLGLRIGEVVEIKLEHLDFLNNTILIQTEKSMTSDLLPLHAGVREALRSWVNEHHVMIREHAGYVFFSKNLAWQREHISKNWLSNYFRECREEAGLTQTYAMTRERDGRSPRRQYRLTSHSHRHTFGTYLWQITHDPKLVQKGLRQRDSKSADTYIYVEQDAVHAAIRQGFAEPVRILQEK